MEYAEVSDLYEAAYLITQGGRIEEVQCITLSESLGCTFTVSCADIIQHQNNFLNRSAVVNLHAFRSAYNQVNRFMHEAKKSYDRERRRNRDTGSRAAGGDA
ncbi:hypothetical protein K7I13_11425 [Brucepastera parasyntrophica]|uniref:hypothetical protein n=1 Tax=Brucepastera parasyntrophica TaxID=2880008 RepID=UPI00210E7C29|nr:hypothetical protein [Brucepastera parasyntrophica]ULQ59100.1 hypothetical protein K7I13_11360 [Brucepastera parasyntrophica]ULQ59111.1 hypothetical protein K7I13_11425 [Brucepastera parasyntrophica]